jgi:hypothetical protein
MRHQRQREHPVVVAALVMVDPVHPGAVSRNRTFTSSSTRCRTLGPCSPPVLAEQLDGQPQIMTAYQSGTGRRRRLSTAR